MRSQTAKLNTIFVIVVIGFAYYSARTTSADPPKRATELASNQAAEDVLAEIPAVPFLTLGLIRDSAVQTELGLDAKQINGVRTAIAQVDESFWRLRDVPVAPDQFTTEPQVRAEFVSA